MTTDLRGSSLGRAMFPTSRLGPVALRPWRRSEGQIELGFLLYVLHERTCCGSSLRIVPQSTPLRRAASQSPAEMPDAFSPHFRGTGYPRE